MDLETLKKELKNGWIEGKPFVFVSYASLDAEMVYPIVLALRNKGFNVYIDLELTEKATANWLDNISKVLFSADIRGIISFLSINYMRSYASMIELLINKSNKMRKDRGESLPVIYIALDENMRTPQAMGKYIRSNDIRSASKDIVVEMQMVERTVLKETILDCKMESYKNEYEVDKLLDEIKNRHDVAVNMLELAIGDSIAIQEYGTTDECVAMLVSNFTNTKNDDLELEILPELVNENYELYDFEEGEEFGGFEDGEGVKFGGFDFGEGEEFGDIEDGEVDEFGGFDFGEGNEFGDIEDGEVDEFGGFDFGEGDEFGDIEDGEVDEFSEFDFGDTWNDNVKTKKASLTGDIKYTLYGHEYEENQSDMMLRVFAQVLKRHENKVSTLPEQAGMNCAKRYEDIVAPNTKDAKPSYFRVCRDFKFSNGQSVCIGTAYGSGEKMKKIAKLLEICGEDSSIFQSDQIQIPAAVKTRKKSDAITYKLFDRTESGDQTEMMCNICKQLIDMHPEKLDELAENTLCITTNREEAIEKSYFRVSRVYSSNDREYIIGTAFNMAGKVKEIEKVFMICGEDIENLQIEGGKFEKKEKQTRGRRKAEKDFLQ